MKSLITRSATSVSVKTLANVAGYVHLHDRFKTYSNVHVVTPYQPIEPGDDASVQIRYQQVLTAEGGVVHYELEFV